MAEQTTGSPNPDRLQELAQLLRSADHLSPEAKAELATLVEELGQSLDPARLSDPARAHLQDHAAHLIEALHGQADEGLLGSAKKRLEETAVRLEAEAPQATGIVRRLIDAIANLGI